MNKLARAAKAGTLDGLTIEMWRGGGLPPPYYKSDQLRFLSVGGSDAIEFASLRFDSHYEPSSVQDKWTIPAAAADIREAAHLLLSLRVFEAQFPEERQTGVPDAISYEIIASAEAVEVQRRYYGKLPEPFGPIQIFIDRLTASAKSSGPPALFHEGHQVKP